MPCAYDLPCLNSQYSLPHDLQWEKPKGGEKFPKCKANSDCIMLTLFELSYKAKTIFPHLCKANLNNAIAKLFEPLILGTPPTSMFYPTCNGF
jgi:hypothetical protein